MTMFWVQKFSLLSVDSQCAYMMVVSILVRVISCVDALRVVMCGVCLLVVFGLAL